MLRKVNISIFLFIIVLSLTTTPIFVNNTVKAENRNSRSQRMNSTIQELETAIPEMTGATEMSLKGLEKHEPKYVHGFPNDMFFPDRAITNAEFARILYYLYIPGTSGPQISKKSDISEDLIKNRATTTEDIENVLINVESTHWASNYIKTLYDLGYLPVGSLTFKPDAPLYMADFIAIVSRIKGYPVSVPHSENTRVTRAEAVSFLNAIEGRSDTWTGSKQFSDVPSGYWAYEKIMNAANGD